VKKDSKYSKQMYRKEDGVKNSPKRKKNVWRKNNCKLRSNEKKKSHK
jgi:hypothetical protein